MRGTTRLFTLCLLTLALSAILAGPVLAQQSTTGPTPPPGVKIAEPKFTRSQVTIPGVPGYLWRHGCGPTAVGMVIGYYDLHGCPNMVAGNASTQTGAVDAMMADDSGDPDCSNPDGDHYQDYSCPVDNGGTGILTDRSESGGAHADNCVADFMRTSWSSLGNFYGWSYNTHVPPSFVNYINMVAPQYNPVATNYYFTDVSWASYKAQIDAGKPVVFLVDTDGNGGTDHFVTAVGYDDASMEYGVLDTWAPVDVVRWEDWREINNGDAWGIHTITYFDVEQGPIAICSDVIVSADGNCEAVSAPIDDGSYHPDGEPIIIAQNPPGPYPLGDTPCQLVVTDLSGFTDVCYAMVTVVDDTPPTIDCPSDITVDNDPGECGADVSFTVTFDDNCPGASLTVSPASGSFFDVGTTMVSATATDGSGNTNSCSFYVTVNDTEAPVVTCPSSFTVPNDPDECGAIVTYSYVATDNCPSLDVVTDPASGSFFDVGTTVVNITATDPAGNTDACDFEVTVVDTQKPVITCPVEAEVEFVTPSTATADYEATATDNCTADPAIYYQPPPGSTFPIGTNSVLCIAEDDTGNRDSCDFYFHLAYVDIKPGSCPNPLNIKPYLGGDPGNLSLSGSDGINPGEDDMIGRKPPQGLLPVAILGLADFDVRDVNPESIMLNGVAPLRWAYEDVTAPASGETDYCGCVDDRPDGFTDLTLKFSRDEIVATLGAVADGDVIQLILTGKLSDLTPLYGGDCVLIRGPKDRVSAIGLQIEESTVTTGLIGANPNPFNPSTTLSFSLGQAADYTITIFNVTGQVVKEFRGTGHAGLNEVIWDASSHASGVYLYRLNTLGYSETKKMLLLK